MADLRDEADGNYYFGELKIWNDSSRRDEVGILVEAKSDEKLYSRFFHPDCVYFCFNGWAKLLDTLSFALKHKIEGILGIIDADFRRITGAIPSIENLFITDHHDSEMMIINSSVWDEILSFYADSSNTHKGGKGKLKKLEESKKSSLLDILLDVCKPISALRYLSYSENLNLKFRILSKGKYKYLDYNKFIDKESLDINLDSLIKEVESKSQSHNLFSKKPELKEKFTELLERNIDLLEFNNGHDMINIFSLSLEKAISNKSSSKKVLAEELERNLIISYRLEDFQQTNLYQDLINWEKTNNPPYQLFS